MSDPSPENLLVEFFLDEFLESFLPEEPEAEAPSSRSRESSCRPGSRYPALPALIKKGAIDNRYPALPALILDPTVGTPPYPP